MMKHQWYTIFWGDSYWFELGRTKSERGLDYSEYQPSIQTTISEIGQLLLKVCTESLPIELKTEIVTEWCFKKVSNLK